jgi:hypothetical protein
VVPSGAKARVFLGFDGAAESRALSNGLLDKFSISDDGDDNGALPAADIALEMKDLLPSPEDQLSIGDRHGERRSEEGGLQMGMAVAIVPCLLMTIIAAGRDQFIQDGWHVGAQPGFKFNGADRGCASRVEYVDDSGHHAGLAYRCGHLIGDVMHVAMALGGD